MASPRIRTIKPDLWSDEKVGALSRDARLLFIATISHADDEGLIQWSPSFLRSRAFAHDQDMSLLDVATLMRELEATRMVFAYQRAPSSQEMTALVVQFSKHQRIDRKNPPSRPLPPATDRATVMMYAERDKWVCGTCRTQISGKDMANSPVVAHLPPKGKPVLPLVVAPPSEVKAVHRRCQAEFTKAQGLLGVLPQDQAAITQEPPVVPASTVGYWLADMSTSVDMNVLSPSFLPSPVDVSDAITAPWDEPRAPSPRPRSTPTVPDDRQVIGEYGPVTKPVDDATAAQITAICDALWEGLTVALTAPQRRQIKRNKWADDVRLMLLVDQWPADDVLTVVQWGVQDTFWRTNLRSMAKVRKHAMRLMMEQSLVDWCSTSGRPVPAAASKSGVSPRSAGQRRRVGSNPSSRPDLSVWRSGKQRAGWD